MSWLDDVVWTAAFVAVVGGMYVVAYRMEPHWVSKDGQRFICNAQVLDRNGMPRSGWREYRVEVRWDGSIATRRRSNFTRRDARLWRMQAKSPDAPKNKVIYLFGPDRAAVATGNVSHPGDPDPAFDLMAVRLPAKSRAVPVLDDLVATPYRNEL